MPGEITNIVPVNVEESPVAENQSEDREKYSERLANDHIAFMEEEFGKDAMSNFWEILKKECDRRLEKPPEEILLMDETQQKKFMRQILPWGKYAGTSVQVALKKDRESLEKMATKPLLFQVQLSRFLASVNLKKPKKKSK